jgi:hypothetical protein
MAGKANKVYQFIGSRHVAKVLGRPLIEPDQCVKESLSPLPPYTQQNILQDGELSE